MLVVTPDHGLETDYYAKRHLVRWKYVPLHSIRLAEQVFRPSATIS